MQTMLDLMSTAKPPWFSADSIARHYENLGYYALTGEDVAKCLNCPLPECVNCLGGNTGNRCGRPKRNSSQVGGQMEIA